MIKKTAAYCFLFLANIVLLAHAVLPHHHHQQQVCIERTHCAGDEEGHNHNKPVKDHQHDGNTNSTACVFKLAVVLPSAQGRLLKECDDCTDTHHHDFGILPNFGYVYFQPVSEVISYTPVLSSFFISFVTPTLGLRAPPKA